MPTGCKSAAFSLNVGILALQGAFLEHRLVLERLGVHPVLVRRPEQLEEISGLFVPGGESTTIGMLLEEFGLAQPLKTGGLPIFGTCAGMILLAKDIEGSDQPRLGLMDITVRRNAFGRQRESFETALDVTGLDGPFHAVFIRAPHVVKAAPEVEVRAEFQGHPVFCQQGRIWAAAFHPELSSDDRLHEAFLAECRAYAGRVGLPA